MSSVSIYGAGSSVSEVSGQECDFSVHSLKSLPLSSCAFFMLMSRQVSGREQREIAHYLQYVAVGAMLGVTLTCRVLSL